MKKAILVTGPESSGNRLFAAMCVRGGCAGEGSTNQIQTIRDIPTGNNDFVLIKHRNHQLWVDALVVAGYSVYGAIMLREGFARDKSAFQRGHKYPSYTREHRQQLIREAINAFTELHVPYEFIHYESLGETFVVEQIMKAFGLRTDNITDPLYLPGQEVALDHFENQNGKYYRF